MHHAKRLLAALATSGLVLPAGVVVATTASPANAVIAGTVLSGTPSSMWQTNNEVDALAIAGGVIYAGGQFTQVRPPGTNANSNQAVNRTYLAAFNANTGALITGFNTTLNGRVRDIAVSPDGSRVYIAGNFTSVNGSTRTRVAALNPSTGALITAFNATPNRTVMAVAATNSTVYLGGDFSTVGGQSHTNLAAVSAATGAVVNAFNPVLAPPPPQPGPGGTTTTPSARVNTVAVPTDGSRVLAGGSFRTVNGVDTGGIVSLNPGDGSLATWQASTVQPINTNCLGRTTDILAVGDTAYVTAEGDPPGCYEGTYRARISDGQMQWNSPCLGASQGIAYMDGVLYKGSHQHDCAFSEGGAFGGYVGGTSRETFLHRYLVGQDVTDGSFVHWTPNTNAAMTTSVGPHVMAAGGGVVVAGGDFTRVEGQAQQGLTRFVAGGNTATPETPGRSFNGDPWPNTLPILVSRLQVTVQPTAANTLTVEVPAVNDADSGTLTYRIYRDGGSTPVATLQAESWPWTRPVMRFDDTGLAPGSTHSYRVSASDGVHTSSLSTAVSGTVRSTGPAPLATQYGGLGSRLWWRLGDTGTTAADSSGTNHPGTYQGGTTRNQPGVVSGNGAVTLDGSSGYVSSQSTISAPGAFSQSAWFRTRTTRGGVIVAQSTDQTGPGSGTDRMITMDNNGALIFAMKAGPAGRFGVGTINIRNQGPSWNDGAWHQVVGTYDGNGGAALYVDGWLQGTAQGTPFNPDQPANGLADSYVRAGYADLSTMQVVFGFNYYNNKWPASEFFNGSLDEVVVVDRALSPGEVAELFAAGVADADTAPVPNQRPTARFTVDHSDLTGLFDAATSGDADGTIASYDWSFGDGTTGSGQSVSHPYATAGTYTVRLTVTDDDGDTDSVEHDVTVTDPPPPPPGDEVESTAVAAGSAWRWRYAQGAPDDGWNQLGFDATAAGWSLANAVFGWGNASVVTDISAGFASASDRPRTSHYTRTFTVPDASRVTRLVLDTVANDGIVVYVNGVEVRRHNMPTGDITHNTWASSARNTATANGDPVVIDVPTSLLVDGTNVVAAEVHVNYRNTRDITFDLTGTLTTVQ